jgi:hypothetical protein
LSDNTPSEVLWSFDLQEGLQRLPEEYKAEVQIRKAGETRYGKGKIEITEDRVRLRYKKFMSKKQEVTLSRSDIEKAEFQNRELPIEIVGPGFFWDQGWITLELVMRDGEGYTLYVGQPGNLPAGKVGPYMEKFMTIYLMLNGDRALHDEPELAGSEEEDSPAQSSPDASPQYTLKCPKCGAAIEKSWICFQCQVEDQPYYRGGAMNHKCIKCEFDKHPFVPDPKLLCDACMQHSVSSEWTPA